jgi:hypothetical protein
VLLWCEVCVVRCVVSGVLFVECCEWRVVSGVWCVVYGVLCMVCCVWCVVCRVLLLCEV